MAQATDFLADMIRQEEWRREAACKEAGPSIFYSDEKDDVKAARQICSGCPVNAECLTWALDNPLQTVEGIWAGTSYGQRKRMRARRRELEAAEAAQ